MNTKSLTKLLAKELGPISFGGFLRAARTIQNLTQKEMANYIGIPKSMLCDIEKGRLIASIDLAFNIANKCGLSKALAIRDQIKRSGFKLDVRIKKAA